MTSFVEFMILIFVCFILSLRGDNMLNIDIDVVRGVMFINLEGELNKRTVSLFEEEINYLVYKQGMHLFVFNFNNLNNIEYGMVEYVQNKIIEIFLNCGKVAICGLNELNKKLFGNFDRLFYVNNERDAFEYLYI